MIPNITRGDRMSGLLVYLQSDGRYNEHEEPHVVAGDGAVMAWHSEEELDRDAALSIAKHLDRPHRDFGVDGPGGKHVWHCSLSVRAEEGPLTDEKWREIADDFMRQMDLDDPESPKSPVRWAAVRHGLSANGNDHIHIVASLVRDDGTKASVHNDFRRAQEAARELEKKHGLEQLESQRTERATRGYKPGELEADARRRARARHERSRKDGAELSPWHSLPRAERTALIEDQMRRDQPRHELARTVRGCASASRTEDEFVRRMRRQNLIVKPRFASGRDDVITGYSVAKRPEAGERPIWYGGGHLARDLSLPRLRTDAGWSDSSETATTAAAEWRAAGRNQRTVAQGREAQVPSLDEWQTKNEALRELTQRLRNVPMDDHQTWATVARQTSGAFAAWSKATEPVPGELAKAADALSLSAQTKRPTRPVKDVGSSALTDAAMMLSVASTGGRGTVAQAVMLRQLIKLSQAVYENARATQQARMASQMHAEVRESLNAVRRRLPSPTDGAQQPQRQDLSGRGFGQEQMSQEQRARLERLRASQGSDVRETLRSPVPSRTDPTRPRDPLPTRDPGRDR